MAQRPTVAAEVAELLLKLARATQGLQLVTAVRYYAEALDLLRGTRGKQHQLVTCMSLEYALVLEAADRLDEAQAALEEAVALARPRTRDISIGTGRGATRALRVGDGTREPCRVSVAPSPTK